MTVRPPSRPGGRALAILVAGALTACIPAPVPPPGSPTTPTDVVVASPGAPGSDRMLVLVGTPGAMRLTWLGDGSQVAVALPADDIRWVAGSPSIGLVATAGPGGRIYLSGPVTAGGRPSWRELVPADAIRRRLGHPLADAVADPRGGAIVAVAADPAAGAHDGHLAILDPAGGPTRSIAFDGHWDGRAPAWIGPDRVAVSTRDGADRTALTIVDLGHGDPHRWGSAIGAFAVSGDGTTVAYQDRGDGRIVVGAFDPSRPPAASSRCRAATGRG